MPPYARPLENTPQKMTFLFFSPRVSEYQALHATAPTMMRDITLLQKASSTSIFIINYYQTTSIFDKYDWYRLYRRQPGGLRGDKEAAQL